MNRVKKVTGLLAVVLLAATQVSCGAQTEAAPDLVATAARLDKLAIDITGDIEEIKAAELLNYHRVEGGIAACMQETGRAYKPVPYVSFYDVFTDADLGYGDSRATVVDSLTSHGRRIVLNELAIARLTRAGALNRTVADADMPALQTCAARFQSRDYHDFDPPVGVMELADLADLVEPVQRDPAVVSAMAGYPTCMKQQYGFTVTDRDEFLSSPRINRDHAPRPGERAGLKWRKGLNAIDKAFKADTDCRRPAYETAMTLLADRIGPWRDRNRDKLFAIRAGWRKAVADAKRLSS
ncbi:hypothetical protein [Actinoplanes derwentensis]|uniref:Uncharacterized protein n=1 Tax=Actinoplanes derwentensis TaxID=113562 RepID=A0A1H1Z2I8_9ACTN|nr:hypothetical protein [Actinoplanes derwentensis]GID81405.1 hypothetical protein Ade03nite_03290 [Actinoplanes derwentensis]SDT28015.1 hypothetical protein SAMN04489716_3113 [Actinoplanes derwentensis]